MYGLLIVNIDLEIVRDFALLTFCTFHGKHAGTS